MEFTHLIRLIIVYVPVMVIGAICLFFPGRVLQIRAKIQEKRFRKMGMSDDDIDQLPIYSTFFGQDYSKRLKSEKETPEKHKSSIIWVRIIGLIIILIFSLSLCGIALAIRTGQF